MDVNVGFTRLYGASVSWKTPTNPCAKEIEPRFAFDRLFRTNAAFPKVRGVKHDSTVVQQSLQRDNGSILDLVLDDAKSLQEEGIEFSRIPWLPRTNG